LPSLGVPIHKGIDRAERFSASDSGAPLA